MENDIFFNSDGIMQTGLVDYENKRYYFDADGMLQTGDVVINGKTYHFLEDGSLEGYVVDPAKAAKEASSQEAVPEETSSRNPPRLHSRHLRPFPKRTVLWLLPLTMALALTQTGFWTVWKPTVPRPPSFWSGRRFPIIPKP